MKFKPPEKGSPRRSVGWIELRCGMSVSRSSRSGCGGPGGETHDGGGL